MTSQTRRQIMTIHILFNIPRSKGKQKMKFSQLMEYKMKNIFREKSYRKCGGELSRRPFNKKSKFGISLEQQSDML